MDSDLVSIVDKDDRVLKSISRKEMREKHLIHRTSHFFLFNSKNEIFITKRSKNKDYAPGKWEIGQGGVMDANESYETGAKRELFEELGLNCELTFLFKTYYEDSRTRLFASVYKCKSDQKPKLQKEEIDEGKFVSLEALEKMIANTKDDFTPDSLAIYIEYKKSYE